MSENTKIEWADATWNPASGCTKLSPGCAHCYIASTPPFRMQGRRFDSKTGSTDIQFHPDRLEAPLHWLTPRRVFVNSLSDLFHESIRRDFIVRVYATMVAADWHIFQLLTKRPERRQWLLEDPEFRRDVAGETARLINAMGLRPGRTTMNLAAWNSGAARNIWEGVTAENQRWANIRVPILLDTPAALRFVSYEPALGPVDFTAIDKSPDDERTLGNAVLDWIIIGGESGPKARPFDIAWARGVVAQCQAAGVPVFVKQLGAHPCFEPDGSFQTFHHSHGSKLCKRLRDRKGATPSEWPEDLRVRQMPEVSICGRERSESDD